MKRRITVEQINELSKAQKEKLRDMWVPENGDYYIDISGEDAYQDMIRDISGFKSFKNGISVYKEYKLPLLDIAQIINLLHYVISVNYRDYELQIKYRMNTNTHECKIILNSDNRLHDSHCVRYPEFQIESLVGSCSDNLCDALWSIIKEIL